MVKLNGLKKFILFCLILMLIVSGCTPSSQTDGASQTKDGGSSENTNGEKVLKVAVPAPAGKLDPHFTTQHTEWEITQPIFNGLLRFKPGTASFETIEGDLAESWDVSEDGLTWTFHLRKGVQWHKGYGELTSEDVKWSIERVMDPKVGSPSAVMFKHIEKIETPDKYTVAIILKQPYPSLPLSLVGEGSGGGAIVKKEAIENGTDDESKLIGTGPFILESHTPGESAVLVKNEEYFRGEPKLDKIEFYVMRDVAAREVAMDKGEIHMTYGEPDQMWVEKRRANKDLNIIASGLPMVWSIHVNKKMKPMDNILVRQAIAHAIDYKSLMESLGSEIARPVTSILSDSVYGHADVGTYEYDPKKAKELLAEAGYPDGLTLPETLTPNLPAYVPVNTFIQEQLRQVGIDAPMKQVDLTTWMPALYEGKNPINLQIGVQRAHGAVHLFRAYHSTTPAKYIGYGESDELLEKAELEQNEDKALQLLEEIQQRIKDDFVSFPMFETVQVNAVSKKVDLGYEVKDTVIYMLPKYETTDLK